LGDGGDIVDVLKRFWKGLVAQDGEITLPELAGELEASTGVAAHAASIGGFLRKLGNTYKKLLVATARLRTCAKKRRPSWFRHHFLAVQALSHLACLH
jgi:transposase